MNLYKISIEKNDNQPGASHWGDQYYFVIAANFANAEDKSAKFVKYGKMKDITLVGQVTHDKDVILLKDRF